MHRALRRIYDPLISNSINKTKQCCFTIRVKSTTSEQNDHRAKIMARGLPEKKPLPGVKSIVLVASGKGGVGKTTTAVNLACAMKVIEPDKEIGLLDADVFGPSVPLMMNISGEPMLNDDNLIEPLLNYGIKWRAKALPPSCGLFSRLLRQAAWPQEIVFFLRSCTDIICNCAIVVTTPQSAALQVTKRGVIMFEKLKVPIIGMVENMSYAICEKCGTKNYVFGNETKTAAKEMGLEIIESFEVDHNMSECINSGKPAIYALPDSTHAEKYRQLANKVFKYIDSKDNERIKITE
ncbi:hypothetical protein K1T71_002992 [Dendrolimus kikuchii]|uniref:Uncharacterized protein n=1 Tax=Dendrolimus kikuchii TaxID=765133 RepID=A0ACC1DBX0_9NEOP|nr:hypothetical protein K1T71_002992 [Dendrolimus kikuchii]